MPPQFFINVDKKYFEIEKTSFQSSFKRHLTHLTFYRLLIMVIEVTTIIIFCLMNSLYTNESDISGSCS